MITLALRLSYKKSIGTSNSESDQHTTESEDNEGAQTTQNAIDFMTNSQNSSQKKQ